MTIRPLTAVLLATVVSTSFAEPATYDIDPTHTFVMFEVDHFNTSTLRARFDKKSGSVTLDRAAATGSVDLKIDTASISSGTPAFDNHLKGGAFFNVATYPEASFVGNKLSLEGDKVKTVEGTLTLLGKSQPVTLTAKRFNCYTNPMLHREVCGGDFETTLTRSKWGLDFGLNMGMVDAVKVVIQVEAIRRQP